MDKVAVDPKLFITCRLCLEDMGLYQIVPMVQKQIKFCFDIEVAPFDGLPQLICKKCEAILSDYSKKKTFIEETQRKVQKNEEAKEERVEEFFSHSSLKSKKEENNNANSTTRKRKSSHKVSSSNNSVSGKDNDDSNALDICKKPRKKFVKSASMYLKYDYNKQYACKFCSVSYSKKSIMLKHSITFHSKVKKKFPEVFKYFCVVKLNRIDEQLNSKVKLNKIEYSRDKFIQHENDINFYITYIAKKQINCDINNTESSGSESENDLLIKREKRKPRRLLSRSSNDTVVIPDKLPNDSPLSSDFESEKNKVSRNKNHLNCEQECINIDSESTESFSELSNSVEDKIVDGKCVDYDFKTIQNIIDVCRNKYIKRIAETSKKADLKSHLKHKILSIGRKIINNQGFSCTGLLRFMEHENLEIAWIPNNPTKALLNGKASVRIFTKIKEEVKDSEKELGWTNEETLSDYLSELPPTNTPKQTKSLLTLSQEVGDPKQVGSQAVLYATSGDIEGNSISSKLLNASPVANPKQLPKKLIQIEMKPNTLDTTNIVRNENNDETILIEVDDELSDSNLCMPVITSTTSLAFETESQKCDTQANNTVSSTLFDQPPTLNMNNETSAPTPAPRIKVKPVSELMAINPTQTNNIDYNTTGNKTWHLNQNQHCPNQNVSLTCQTTDNIYLYNITPQNPNTSHSMSMLVPNNNLQAIQHTVGEGLLRNNDVLILDTVEMPNTKTDSPFKYLKNLLQIHNILLLDSKNGIDQHFTCLIKFKVLFKQENVKPVTLCLSLHCLENIFYIDIKNGDRLHIDMIKISANWQWEIIKIYQGDVINKILFNSQKISTEMYETTKRFLCLLKSIKKGSVV
ncbi:LOW QUALITY PROTEIN: uncharacterized protein ACR2FA_012240 [Aphomia sociella]